MTSAFSGNPVHFKLSMVQVSLLKALSIAVKTPKLTVTENSHFCAKNYCQGNRNSDITEAKHKLKTNIEQLVSLQCLLIITITI